MTDTKRYYMHTLDGRPAFFHEDGADSQMVFASLRDHWRDDYYVVQLRSSVKEIRKDQARHLKFRERHGWEVGELDYVIVSLEAGVIPWKQPKAPTRKRRIPGRRPTHASAGRRG